MIFDDYINDVVNDFKKDNLQKFAEELKDLLRSNKAVMSVKKINALFKSKKLLDSDGNLVVISNPSDIANNIVVFEDHVMVAVTDDQDMWFRADVIFGNDILSELGIKYKQNEG